jgi:hypothetical protein
MSNLPPKKHWSQLVVEASEDSYAIRQLIQKVCPGHWNPGLDSPWPYMTAPEGSKGWEGAIKLAAALIKGEQASRIGLVVDADKDPLARWQAVRDRFDEAGATLPTEPSCEVFPGRTESQRIGVWLMPDNRSPGALEEFLVPLVGAKNLLWWWSGEAVAEAQRWGAGISDPDLLKSRLHSWLAWQKKRPGMPLGLALESNVLDTRRASLAIDAFVAWFRKLYELDDDSSP